MEPELRARGMALEQRCVLSLPAGRGAAARRRVAEYRHTYPTHDLQLMSDAMQQYGARSACTPAAPQAARRAHT